ETSGEVDIEIYVFGGGVSEIKAKLDRAEQSNMIKRSKANEIGHAVATGTWILLRYYRSSSPKSHEEYFLVVENATHDIILGATSHVFRVNHPSIHPLQFQSQSQGSYLLPGALEPEREGVDVLTLNWKAEQAAQKKRGQQANARNDEDTREIEEKEARRRREQTQYQQQYQQQYQPYQQQNPQQNQQYQQPYQQPHQQPYQQPYQQAHQQPYQQAHQQPYQQPYQQQYQQQYQQPYQYPNQHQPQYQQPPANQ
ncbi:MAG: hypothetical protein M1839_006055, partial [Geoglossum umbratile]